MGEILDLLIEAYFYNWGNVADGASYCIGIFFLFFY